MPWPPDYGGAIDMMNRLRMLKKSDIGIHLHYFSYNERGTPNELNQFCESIHVYQRKSGSKGLSVNTPYIIASRVNSELIRNLQQDNHPLLLEGIHCTGILRHLELGKRKVVVRMHNEESIYYREMATATRSLWRKLFFYNESRLIHQYTHRLPQTCTYACISTDDVKTLHHNYHLKDVRFLPAFPAWQAIKGEEGIGNLCLYHGNLSVPENEKAAIWLLREVFTRIRKPFVIAGKQPSRRLQKLAHLCQHTCLVADPTDSELNDLIRKAHINVLPSFNRNNTGIRLKLLHALYEGRHCVVNDAMVKGTGLESACHSGASANAFASIIAQLYHQPFTGGEIMLRKKLLGNTYDNEKNTQMLIQWLY